MFEQIKETVGRYTHNEIQEIEKNIRDLKLVPTAGILDYLNKAKALWNRYR